jgi:hypothetical protein
MGRGTRGLLVLCTLALGGGLGESAEAAKHVNQGPVKFHASSGRTEVTVETLRASPDVSCTDSRAAGEITPATAITIEYRGCGAAVKECASPGAAVGRITTKLLAGGVGYVKAPDEIGLNLAPAKGEVVFEFSCPDEKRQLMGDVQGSVIGRLSPVNKMSTTFTLALKEGAGKQEIERFEGGLKATLTGEVSLEGKPSESGAAREVATLTVSVTPQAVGKKAYPDPAMIKSTGTVLEWGRCRRAKEGRYHDANCTQGESASDPDGKYEFFPVPA